MNTIRLVLISLGATLCACATDSVSRAEHAEVLASMRALRAENARLDARVERLEGELKTAKVVRAEPAKASAPRAEAPRPAAETGQREDVPSLTVVKLKPRKEAPPRLPTQIEVVEPSAEVVTDAPPATDEADATETAAVEQLYLAGLDALKTGNPEGGIATLKQFARDWPKHPKADNALFYAAVGHMAARDFQDAEAVLELALRQYPAGDATLEAMVKLAECKSRLNRQADARATWEKIVATYPGTQAALVAQSRLAASAASSKE